MADKNMSFEESMKKLEDIVAQLERNEKPLDETIRLFEEGLHLVRSCDEKLHAFETQVNEIVSQNGGNHAV